MLNTSDVFNMISEHVGRWASEFGTVLLWFGKGVSSRGRLSLILM